MPLSEREQQILDEIEKSLYEQDPKFAHSVRKQAPLTRDLIRARNGGLLFFAGIVLLVLFFVTRLVIVGVLAFSTMVAGVVVLSTSIGGVARGAKEEAGRSVQGAKGAVSRWGEDLRRRFRRP